MKGGFNFRNLGFLTELLENWDKTRKSVLRFWSFRRSFKGPYIKDVHTEGGRGVGPKADIVREVAWIYSYKSSKNADKGGRGSKIPKSLRTSFMYGPQVQPQIGILW